MPSFSQHEIENRGGNLPAESVQPEFDLHTMKYVGLDKTKLLIEQNVTVFIA